MSHIVTIKAKYKNANIIKEVCKKLGFEYEFTDFKLYNYTSNSKGHRIKLADYCSIFITEDGDLVHDDMINMMARDNQFNKFRNTYCLIETEHLLKRQNLKYKIIQSEESDEIKIEVIA
jgi:hypothetical protein